ncbi:hypothetical protein [Haloferula sp.]|uniref:hypothetical protein n=1 Tax=Haloferula sp. TaxID=2497595 RepID=UPI00329DED85
MKSIVTIAGCAALLAGVFFWEESRVSELKKQVGSLEEKLESLEADAIRQQEKSAAVSEQLSKAQRSRELKREAAKTESPAKGAELGETMRKVYENKAGQAMIKESNRQRASNIYGRLIDRLDLSPEEEEHFINLLAPALGEQDRVGMQLFGAKSDEERMQIIADMEKDQVDREEAIMTFLNNDEDFAEYERYHARKSEYEQIASINTVMEDLGSPMEPAQESQLIEAMFGARTETGLSEKWEGRQGFYQYGEPGVSKRFEDDWSSMQTNLNGRVGDILNDSQQVALQEHQKQVEQFILMGIRMAEGMIEGAKKQQGGQ